MQYLLNTAQYPRLKTPRAPLLVEAPDDAAIFAAAQKIVEQLRSEGAEKAQVEIRRAVNLVLVGRVGDDA